MKVLLGIFFITVASFPNYSFAISDILEDDEETLLSDDESDGLLMRI